MRSRDLDVDRARLPDNGAKALLLAIAFDPTLGYDRVAAITREAMSEELTPPAAVITQGPTRADANDHHVDPSRWPRRRRDPEV